MRRLLASAAIIAALSIPCAASAAGKTAAKSAAAPAAQSAENLRAKVTLTVDGKETVYNIYILSGQQSGYSNSAKDVPAISVINLLPVLTDDETVDYNFQIEISYGFGKTSMQGTKRIKLGVESMIADTPTEKVSVQFFLDK